MSIALHSRRSQLLFTSSLLLVLVCSCCVACAAAEYVPRVSFPSSVCVDVDCGVLASARAGSLQRIASVPLKGWNSYDSWLWRVNETTVLAHIDFIADNLLRYGYHLVTIDYYWYSARHTERQQQQQPFSTSRSKLLSPGFPLIVRLSGCCLCAAQVLGPR